MKKSIITAIFLYFITALYAAETLEKTVSFSKKGSAPGEIKNVADIETAKGFVYVLDSGNYRVSVFREDGAFFLSFGSFGAGKGEFNSPSRIAIDNTGCVYVLDYYSVDHDKNRAQSAAVNSQYYYPRIQRFSPDGKFLLSYGRAGTKNGEFLCTPSDIAVDKNNRLIVLDSCNSRVQVFNASGKFVMTYGSYGSCETCLDGASRLDVDIDNNVLVLDVNNSRFLKFSPEGNPLPMPDIMGNEDNQILSQSSFKILDNGSMAVLHTAYNRMGNSYYGSEKKSYFFLKLKYFGSDGRHLKTTEAMADYTFAKPPYVNQLISRSFLGVAGNNDVFLLDSRNGVIERYAFKDVFTDFDRINKRAYIDVSGRGYHRKFYTAPTVTVYTQDDEDTASGMLGMNLNYMIDERSTLTFDFSGSYEKTGLIDAVYGVPTPVPSTKRLTETISGNASIYYNRTYDLNENKDFNARFSVNYGNYYDWNVLDADSLLLTSGYKNLWMNGSASIDIFPDVFLSASGSYYFTSDYYPALTYEYPRWDAGTRLTIGF